VELAIYTLWEEVCEFGKIKHFLQVFGRDKDVRLSYVYE
jgi:hypothetical protein